MGHSQHPPQLRSAERMKARKGWQLRSHAAGRHSPPDEPMCVRVCTSVGVRVCVSLHVSIWEIVTKRMQCRQILRILHWAYGWFVKPLWEGKCLGDKAGGESLWDLKRGCGLPGGGWRHPGGVGCTVHTEVKGHEVPWEE